jgi:putative addiction module component (TIGR02574 family)
MRLRSRCLGPARQCNLLTVNLRNLRNLWIRSSFSFLPLGEGPGMRVCERTYFLICAPWAASGIQRQEISIGVDAAVSPHPNPLQWEREIRPFLSVRLGFLSLARPFAVSRCFDIMPAMQSELTEQAKKLSISDRILLVEEIWDTIAEENQAFELTDAQKQELDRRLESARSDAGQGRPFCRTWDEIKAEFMKSR